MSLWPAPSRLPALNAGVIHLWQASVMTLAGCERYFDSLLDDDERARCRAFQMPGDRTRGVVSRGLHRALAAHYLGVAPHALGFALGAFGKPSVVPGSGPLASNVSHSGDVVLLAFAWDGDVGVDVERWNPRVDSDQRDQLTESVFSPLEREALGILPAADREGGFYRIWSRKEAYLKGTGAGISAGLAHFDVSIGGDARLLADRSSPTNVRQWQLHDVNLGAGYSAALAARPSGRPLEQWTAHRLLFSGIPFSPATKQQQAGEPST